MAKKHTSSTQSTSASTPSTPRNVIDARADDKGNITQVKLSGNQNFIPVETAINMAEQGKLANAHAVTKQDGSQYLRTNPDSKSANNLDTMAED